MLLVLSLPTSIFTYARSFHHRHQFRCAEGWGGCRCGGSWGYVCKGMMGVLKWVGVGDL